MTRNTSDSGTNPAAAEQQFPHEEAEKSGQSGQKRRNNPNEQPEQLIIRITRYQPFIDIVSDKRKTLNAIRLMSYFTCLVFITLLALTLSIKRIYPYNDIQTNALGAMTIKDENKEVTYWLFNTAELWATSGIAVKKGDILTIRASDALHNSRLQFIRTAHNASGSTTTSDRLPSRWISSGTSTSTAPPSGTAVSKRS